MTALEKAQRGVFSTSDLKTMLNEPHPSEFGRRVRGLVDQEILYRFTRGYYVTSNFSIEVLSQRIAPQSCISFETILANTLVIGTNPARRLVCTKIGPSRVYKALNREIVHLGLTSTLTFGSEVINGVRYANAEKAVLDVLFFYLRGRKFPFDIYSDINLKQLNMKRINTYLKQYQNPKFVTFAKNVLEIT